MKHKKIWNEALFGIGKWLILGILVLSAGCFYSCGGFQEETEPVMLVAESKTVSETVPGTEDLNPGIDTETTETEAIEAETTEPETIPVCYVYVCGQVHQPGVYVLEEGQRIFEAVELAGGFTEEAAEGYLNLAAAVTDGMKIQVPDKSQAADPEWQLEAGLSVGNGASSGTAGASADSKTVAKVNLNTATKEELMTLTGIGASRAEDIIRYREKNGRFARIEDIMKVSGIKEASFEKIKDQITV